MSSETEMRIRIQKYLAEIGIASRRAIEEMIIEGRISVNRELVASLPCFVDPQVDDIRVDGRKIRPKAGHGKKYVLLNKPRGVVCTQKDPDGRPCAVDLVPDLGSRIYCVGRLDAESTGIILLTDDGDLTQRLTHPSYGVVKTYVVTVDGRLSAEQIAELKAGSYLDGKRTKPTAVKVLRKSPAQSLLEIRLTEGRNREIRRILARLGHKVRRLRRVAIGPVTDKGLKIGHFRLLRPAEVAKLRKVGQDSQSEQGGYAKKGKSVRKRKTLHKSGGPRKSTGARKSVGAGKGRSAGKNGDAGKSGVAGKARSVGKSGTTRKGKAPGKRRSVKKNGDGR